MKKITQFSVNNPVTVSMLVLGILLLGYISFGKLSIDLLPDMNAPRIFVEINAGERPPEEIEKQFVENIESQAIRQKGVAQVSSVCMVGSARITVEYRWGTDMDEAFLDLQKALTTYSQSSDIDEFTITQHDPNAAPVMIIAMLHPDITDMDELRRVGESYIRNELIRLEGIADVSLSGVEEKEVQIETDPFKLQSYNLTTGDIASAIQNMNRNVSGGSIVEMGKKYIIKGTGLVANVADIEGIVLSYRSINKDQQQGQATSSATPKAPILLKDVASVRLVNKQPDNIVRINGQRCIGLSVHKETGSNTVKAVEELLKSLESIKKALPGYEFTIIQNQGRFIQASIGEVKDTLLIGILIAVFVIYIFLRRLKVTAIISLAIPISIVATFNLMFFNGLTLNIMTLGGLALGAGMLVDNAIVVVENIFRNMEQGMSIREAAITGTAEVGGAITASTLTTIVVFLPIVYLHGASSALFRDQAWTVAFSLIASLFVAILVIPMLFNAMYKNAKTTAKVESIRITWYGRLLSKILSHKALVLSLTIVLMAITAFVIPRVGSEFLPKSGSNEFSVDIKLREGTQLERTSETVKNIETMVFDLLAEQAAIVYSQIGPQNVSGSDKSVFQNENTATIKIILKSEYAHQANAAIAAVEEMLATIPDADISISRDETALQETLGTDEAPLVVEIKGNNLDELNQISESIKRTIAILPSLHNVKTNSEEGAPEIDVVLNRYKAGIYGLSVDNIVSQLKEMLMGKSAGKFEKGGEMNDINIKLPELSLSEFNAIKLKTSNGEVHLYEVASINNSVSPKQLIRRNQNRIGKVMADVDRNQPFDQIVEQVRGQISTLDIPADYQVDIVGEEQKREEAMGSLGFALMLSIVLVYMVMASTFESLLHPFTILLTIPLAGVGTVWAFLLIGKPLSIMAYIGIIMLAGIAVNDSIILVDAINKLREKGLSLRDAIIGAGENRIRPIVMTSLTTILALFPLTLGFGESAALRSPMAIAVIAGLVTSTLLTLIVIPCVYYVFEVGKARISGRRAEGRGHRAEGEGRRRRRK
ncbi:MAG: efflux RND transporter permease subunit [Tenuifilaceae bacterium]|jgi:HAE1 family hydrophobic/amphiphilic exporter-1|nr:efflux RND transporter permease subunit [Tenuifilaceae bacterium]